MASQNPQVKYMRKVALVGGSGQVGSYILQHLLSTGLHTVTVLTRTSSTATFPSSPHLNIAKVDYTSSSSLVSALRGNDILIITLSARAPPTLHAEIVAAGAEAGVKCIMPNYYGYGLGERGGGLTSDPILGRFGQFIDDVAAHPGVHWVALCCGFWYEFSLGMGEAWLGFDIKKRSVTLYDDGERKINTSTWDQCGRAVAALLSLPVDNQDGKQAVQDFLDRGLYVSSFLISQRDILESLHRVLGTTDGDWTITYEGVEERYQRGMEEMKSGLLPGLARTMYARLFFASGEGDFETGQELDNANLGLPKEDLDEATMRAVDMVQKGFGFAP